FVGVDGMGPGRERTRVAAQRLKPTLHEAGAEARNTARVPHTRSGVPSLAAPVRPERPVLFCGPFAAPYEKLEPPAASPYILASHWPCENDERKAHAGNARGRRQGARLQPRRGRRSQGCAQGFPRQEARPLLLPEGQYPRLH